MLLSISVSHTSAQSCIYIGGVCVCVCVLVYYLSALFALASGSEVHHLLKGTANVHFL